MLIILESGAVLLVFIYLWYASEKKAVAWLFGIASSLFSAVFFFLSSYYGSMALNLIYMIQGVSGFWHWKWLAPQRSSGFRLAYRSHLLIVSTVVAAAWLTHFVFERIGYTELYAADLLLAGGSIAATWLEIRKDTSCWIYWIICNLGYTALYLYNPAGTGPMLLYAFLMLVLAVFSWFAMRKWIRDSYTEDQSDTDSGEDKG